MAWKNNIGSDKKTLVIKCPECGEDAQFVKVYGSKINGIYVSCKKCEWKEKYKKGTYTSYNYELRKNK